MKYSAFTLTYLNSKFHVFNVAPGDGLTATTLNKCFMMTEKEKV